MAGWYVFNWTNFGRLDKAHTPKSSKLQKTPNPPDQIVVRIPGFRDNSFRTENDNFSTDKIAVSVWRITPLKSLKRNNVEPSSARSN